MLDIGGYRVVLACRSQQEGDAALERLRTKQQQQQQQQQQRQQQGHPGTPPTTELAAVYQLDVTCPRSLESFREKCVDGHLGGKVDILFNNAGVCLAEDVENGTKTHSSVATAAGILRETFAVNFFGALGVAEACMPALMSIAATPTAVEAGISTTEENSGFAAVVMPLTPPTIVWVSSGEGELCFLGAKWRRLLANAASLEEVKSHMSELLSSASAYGKKANGNNSSRDSGAVQQEGEEGDEEGEMAFGPTPAYSLSKAAVNAAVRTWAPRLARPAPAQPVGRATGGVVAGVRLVAVCPGDVLTRMTSAEELARGDVVSPEEAAAAVVKIALGSAHEFPAGKFYRHCEEIGCGTGRHASTWGLLGCCQCSGGRSAAFTTRHPATNSPGSALSGGSNAVLR
eukprot:g9624.t1